MNPATRPVHSLFVKLFLETDADDLLADEGAARRARRAKRDRSARLVRTARGSS